MDQPLIDRDRIIRTARRYAKMMGAEFVVTPVTSNGARTAPQLARELLSKIRSGQLDPRKAAEALGLPFDQDGITAILEAAAATELLQAEIGVYRAYVDLIEYNMEIGKDA